MGDLRSTTLVLADDVTADGATRRDDEGLVVPRRLGRFEVERVLGTGGMGIVYLAHDPELDRKVAVKVLRFDRGVDRPGDARLRLLREARAMAKLSHPNVVPVYAVEALEPAADGSPRLFVAMEYVEGFDLRQWLRQAPRSTEEIVSVFAGAARGLAAAHRAGIIHRDFKPGNVLVGQDGASTRARVVDFGIARTMTALPSSERSLDPVSETATATDDAVLSLELTQRGTVLGTPAYMAPEQHQGVADARSDQFALCVAMWEALHGETPFAGENFREVARAKRTRRWRSPNRRVPRRLQACIERGLDPDPARRWPDMDTLAWALERSVAKHSSRWIAAAALVGLGAALPALASDGQEGCAERDAALRGVWDDDARERARRAIAAVDLPYASDVQQRVTDQLDVYAEQWVDARAEVCRSKDTLAPAVFDVRMGCLEDADRALRALARVLAEADADIVKAAIEATERGLPAVHRCPDLHGGDQPSLVDSPQAEALHDELARAEALHLAGKPQRGVELLRDVAGRAEDAGAPNLVLRTRVALGWALDSAGHYEEARDVLTDAFFTAQRHGSDSLAARSALKLIWLHAYRLSELEAGMEWVNHARPIVERLDDATMRGDLERYIGIVLHENGDFDKAIEHLERAAALLGEARGPDTTMAASSLASLGASLGRMGRYDEARKVLQRSIDIYEKALGPHHPATAVIYSNLGRVLSMDGQHDEALEVLEHALWLCRNGLRPGHPQIGFGLYNLSAVLAAAGREDRALEMLLEAKELFERELDPNHRMLAGVYNNEATYYLRLGRAEDALVAYARSLEINERTLGTDHPETAMVVLNLCQTYLDLERADEALPQCERAVHLYEERPVEKTFPAQAHHGLSMALARTGGDLDLALQLAERSRVQYLEIEDAEEVAELDAWIAELRSGLRARAESAR